jgi:methylmalonyl-CoA mutase
MSSKLFEEFPPVSTERWMDAVTKDLKGADFERKLVTTTLDGVKIRPFYRKEDVPDLPDLVRGERGGGNDWRVREQIREPNVGAANTHALRALTQGAQEIAFLTYPIGAPVWTQAAMRHVLDGVFIDMVPIHWQAGPFSAQTLAMLVNEAQRRGISTQLLEGSVDFDPLMDSAAGWVTGDPATWPDRLVPLATWCLDNTPKMRFLTIRGSLIEKAGASVAQELALTMALLTEYLNGFREAGLDLNQVVPRIELRYAIGGQYFLEIAKMRAQRLLMAQVLEAFGVTSARPWIHADTTSCNKTLYDPHNNLLRATTEAMSAVMAGIDSLSVSAFDQTYNTPDEFSEHLARNTDALLKEEAFLGKVADPLGGSYYVETLTASVADVAWKLFLEIEEAGGFLKALSSGLIAQKLNRTRAAKAKNTNSRRVSIIGTSTYPNPKERRLEELGSFRKANVLTPWTDMATDFDSVRESFVNGASLSEWSTGASLPSTVFDSFRPAWPFEWLRLRTERLVKSGGKQPVVFLLLAGDVARRKARAGFCSGLFGTAGYKIVEGASVGDAQEAQADVVVLCSSDEEYPDLVGPVRQQMNELAVGSKLIVAGYPEASIDALKSAGVDDFVHLKTDAVKFLSELHEALGIPLEETR